MANGDYSPPLIPESQARIYIGQAIQKSAYSKKDVFRSVVDGLWWKGVTLKPVVYGAAIPVSAGGKIFTLFVLIIGIEMIAIPSGLVASALSKVHNSEQ